jgi:hypothetical protein
MASKLNILNTFSLIRQSMQNVKFSSSESKKIKELYNDYKCKS